MALVCVSSLLMGKCIDVLVVGHVVEHSNPISCSPYGLRGPIVCLNPKKKSCYEIYDNLKIPFVPSHYSALIHSANKSRSRYSSKSLPNINQHKSDVEDNLSRYPGGLILYCDLINDSNVNQGNLRIRRSIKDVPIKVWQNIKDLGIKGK